MSNRAINFRIPKGLYEEALRLKKEKGLRNLQEALRLVHKDYLRIKYKRLEL